MKKVVIVDFDLTLVRTNSFELFYKELVRFSIRSFKPGIFCFLAKTILLRKWRKISHAELKRRTLLFLNEKYIPVFGERFACRLKSLVSLDVMDLVNGYKQKGYSIYLCTAAPSLYVEPFLDIAGLRFDKVICTPNPADNGIWFENLGERKKETALQAMNERGEELAILITDHMDDLPLLRIKKEKNILVRPMQKTIVSLNEEYIKYELL